MIKFLFIIVLIFPKHPAYCNEQIDIEAIYNDAKRDLLDLKKDLGKGSIEELSKIIEIKEYDVDQGNIEDLSKGELENNENAKFIMDSFHNSGKFDFTDSSLIQESEIQSKLNKDYNTGNEWCTETQNIEGKEEKFYCEESAIGKNVVCEEIISKFEVIKVPAVIKIDKGFYCKARISCAGFNYLNYKDMHNNPLCPIDCRKDYDNSYVVTPERLEIASEEKKNSCRFNADHICNLKSTDCLDDEVRIIHGAEFKRCWKERQYYQCLGSSNDTCENYKKQNCTQTNSVCIEKGPDNNCLKYKQEYSCRSQVIGKNNKICVKEKAFCMDGSCVDQTYQPNTELNDAIAQLSIFGEVKNGNTKDITIFKGDPHFCHKDPISFNNCCKKEGWGQDAGLAMCTFEEKSLAEKRTKKLCHYVGQYCAKKTLGQCMKYKETYCCFTSELARIVYQQGRKQLGLDCDSPKYPDCKGFTPEELQRIDFSKLDLSDYFASLSSKLSVEDFEEIKARIYNQYNNLSLKGNLNE